MSYAEIILECLENHPGEFVEFDTIVAETRLTASTCERTLRMLVSEDVVQCCGNVVDWYDSIMECQFSVN